MTVNLLKTEAIAMAGGIALLLSTLIATDASAQNSSLVGMGAQRRPLTLAEQSWTHRLMPEPEPIQKNDLVTVLVDYKTQVASEGEIDRKKKADGTLTLQDWILLKGWWAVPDPQTLGDPTVSGKMDNKLKAEATLEARDTMKLSIACRVADIRPNGNLILEGHRTMRNNTEQWDISLTGEVRTEDISVDNTIDSEAIAELNVFKRESGHVRDGYRRGWFLKWLDVIQPF
ncbi:MAG TPA: flagellar basal body L-ring protein FlgH [Thermoguttaceae bacterium]|nr:flagellar basal body L-ring protein FlgH [Thermoguttaceae bacterium]